MWRFISDLSEIDKANRREALDWFAGLAQLSALVPILVVVFIRLVLDDHARPQGNAPGSPFLKAAGRSAIAQSFLKELRPFLWWAGNPVYLFKYPLGSNVELLGAAIWTLWLLWLSTIGTGEDYMHLTKRFGIVGASQLPIHYLLAWKSSWSPVVLATGRSWEELIRIHQLYGRVITFMFALHATFYLNFFVQTGVLSEKLQHLIIILGLIGITSFSILATTALDAMRQRNYRLFFIVHVTVATVVFPVLYFHVHHIRVYIIESAIVYGTGAALRQLNKTEVTATVTRDKQHGTLEITIPKSEFRKPWAAGQHVYLTQSAATFLPPNPFTIISLPTDDNLRLLLRIHSGNTSSLAASARYSPLALHVEGPYGHAHVPRLQRCDTVLLIAGGIGITFLLPLHRSLLAAGHRSQLVWAVRSAAETAWAAPLEDAKIFVTGGGDAEGGVEMQGLDDTRTVERGRPGIYGLVAAGYRKAEHRMGVYVCGPRGMGDAVRREVGRQLDGRHGDEEKEIVFWDEQFGLS